MTGRGRIEHDGQAIEYAIVRTGRRTLGIRVNADGSVEVRAPHRTSDRAIARAAAGRAAWIARTRAAVLTRPAPEPLPDADAGYLARAGALFEERLDACWERFAEPGEHRPRLRVRTMRSRWGSLSPAGAMSLNSRLLEAPDGCVDYVIFHELCHLRVRDHGRGFYRQLERYVPEWRSLRTALRDVRIR